MDGSLVVAFLIAVNIAISIASLLRLFRLGATLRRIQILESKIQTARDQLRTIPWGVDGNTAKIDDLLRTLKEE